MEVTMKEGAEHPMQIPIFVSKKRTRSISTFLLEISNKKVNWNLNKLQQKKFRTNHPQVTGKQGYFPAVTSKLVLTRWAGEFVELGHRPQAKKLKFTLMSAQ